MLLKLTKQIILFYLGAATPLLLLAQQPKIIPLETTIYKTYDNQYLANTNHTVFELGEVDSSFTKYKTATNFNGSILGMLDAPDLYHIELNAFFSKPLELNTTFTETAIEPFKFTDDAEYAIKYLDVLSGLPSNDIYTIFESSSGEIWFAYQGGIGKISGNILYRSDARNGFPIFKVTKIIEYKSSIFIATYGTGIIEIKNNHFFLHSKKSNLKSNHILDLTVFEDKLYCSSYEGGIFYLTEEGKGANLVIPFFEGYSPIINSLCVHENNLYFTHKDGFGFIEENNVNIYSAKQGLPNDEFTTINFDSKGKIYLSAEQNCLVTIDQFNTIKTYLHYKLKWNRVNAILSGKSEDIWLATEQDGLQLINDKKVFKFGTKEGLTSNSLSCLYQDKYHNLWVGTNGHGLNIFIPSRFTLDYHSYSEVKGNSIYQDNVMAIEDGQSLVMFTDSGYYKYTHEELKRINDVAYDSIHNILWIASSNGLFQLADKSLKKYVLKTKNGLINTLLTLHWTKDELIIGDYNNGIIRYKDDVFSITSDWTFDDHEWVENIVFNKDSNYYWVSTHSGNLSHFGKDSITSYNVTRNGIPVRFYSGVSLKDRSFFITNFGLVYEKNKSFYLLQYNILQEADNLRSIITVKNNQAICITSYSKVYIIHPNYFERYSVNGEIVPLSFSKDGIVELPQSNKIYLATNKGMLTYYYFEFKHELKSRKILLQKIEVLDENRKFKNYEEIASIKADGVIDGMPQGLSIPQGNNTLRFKFNYTNWGMESNSSYHYKFDEDEWRPFKDELEISNIKSGEHLLQVKADGNGIVNIEPLTFKFSIIPPFYMTWWFVLTVLLLITGGVWYFIRNISSINFDAFKANTESSFLIKKAQILMLGALFLLLGVDYYQAEIIETYQVNWSLNLIVSICLIALYFLIRLRKFNLPSISKLILASYIIVLLHFLVRVSMNKYNPILTLEFSITLLFSIFIISDTKNIIRYGLSFFVLAIFSTFLFEGSYESKAVFTAAAAEVLVGLILFSVLERNNLARVLFAHKLLQYSRQFVMVANKNAEIIYINDYMLNKLGIQDNEVIGNAWWKYRNWDNEKLVSVRQHFETLIKENKNETYINELKNNRTGEVIQIEWQDTPIEGELVLGIGQDITEKTLRNKELERLSLVATNVTNGVIIADFDSKIEWVNDSFLRLMHYTLDELIGKIPIEIFSGPNTDKTLKELVRYNEPEEGFEILLYTKNKKAFWFHVTMTKVENQEEFNSKKVFILTDITQEVYRKNRSAIVLNNSGDLIYTCNLEGNFDYANSTCKTLLGYEIHEILGKHYSSVLHAEDMDEVIEFYSNLVRKKHDNSQHEFRVYHKSGEVIWLRQTVNFIYDNNGIVEGFLAIAKDITESKLEAIEKQLVALKELNMSKRINIISQLEFIDFEDFIDKMIYHLKEELEVENANIWFNEQNTIVRRNSNDAATSFIQNIPKDTVNYFLEKLEQGNHLVFDESSDFIQVPELISNYIIQKELKSIIACPIFSGGKMWGIISLSKIGQRKKWDEIDIKFIKNVTEIIATNFQLDLRRKVEIKIQESEANFRLLNETIDDVFWLMDLQTKKIIYISPSSTKILGISPNLFFDNDEYWKNYVIDEDKPAIIQAHKKIVKNGYYEVEYRILKNGEIRWIAEKSFGIKDNQGNYVKSSGICRDITDKKEKDTIIEQQNFDILSSINYAQRIQMALLPDSNTFSFEEIDAAVYFEPKDIIGGDFYWFDKVDDTIVFVVGDCTGHGVPGALMTSIGINGLINAVSEQRMINPADILTYLDKYIYSIFNRDKAQDALKDGMDVVIVCFNTKTKKITYATAARPLLAINNEIQLLKGNRRSIGSTVMQEKYESYEINYENNLTLYLFSDGMTDQFGGPDNKKISSKKFYEICSEINSMNCIKQKYYLANFYANWKNKLKQTDDMICMILKFK